MMNSSLWYSQWLSMVSRAVRDDGSIWSFLNWRSLPVYMRAAIDAGLPTSSLMVWDKKWIGPAGPQSLRSTHEFCLLMPHPGFKIVDRSASDVFHFQASSSKPTGHPAEKPVGLLERVVDLTGCGIGECILDPFAGSGTTLVAAKQNGIRAIGIEAEERWCEVAAARLCQNAFDLGEVAS
jgi:site-specific DNA-methyltransferase (adenine-specific)